MFKRMFRIGFGGCGRALVNTFIKQVENIIGNALQEEYNEKLSKWEELSDEDKRKLKMRNLKKLKEGLEKFKGGDNQDKTKLLKDLDDYLDDLENNLSNSLNEEKWMKYERKIIEEIKKEVIAFKKKVEEVNKYYGVLLEGLEVDSATPKLGYNKDVCIYPKYIKDEENLIINKYGINLINLDGFNHRPELQLLVLSIKDIRSKIYNIIQERIHESRAGRGYFFFVGLGGGTGTGVISPFVEESYKKEPRGHFVLGVLSGREDKKYLNAQQPWFRRCFNILLALNDLTATYLDGIILVDNEKIIEKIKNKKIRVEKIKEIINEEIIRAIYLAFGETACEQEGLDWTQIREAILYREDVTPIFVPCYYSGNEKTEELIENAIKNGKMAECDPKKADKIFIFVRSIENESNAKEKLREIFKDKKIEVVKKDMNARKVREFLKSNDIIVLESKETCTNRMKNEVLVLLRNPDIKETLDKRLKVAKSFVDLLSELVELIEKNKVKTLGKSNEKEILEKIIDDIASNRKYKDENIKKILDQIPKDEIVVEEDEKTEKKEMEEIKEILNEAKNFLFPGKASNYNHMKKIVENLKKEMETALEKLNNGNWPIFKSSVFDIEEDVKKHNKDVLENLKEEIKRLEEEIKVLKKHIPI